MGRQAQVDGSRLTTGSDNVFWIISKSLGYSGSLNVIVNLVASSMFHEVGSLEGSVVLMRRALVESSAANTAGRDP